MRPEQLAHDTRERDQRVYDDEACEWCGRTLLGNETVRFYFDRPLLCGQCGDRYRRDRW